MDKLYICSNYGEYPDSIDVKNKLCGWTCLETCSDSLSTTYQRAYNYMRKVNKAYGRTSNNPRCHVLRLKKENYNSYYWSQLEKIAESNSAPKVKYW